MTRRQDRDAIYVQRQLDTEIIVLCVRWYISYRLSYRDLVAMKAERGVIISHTTIMQWVIRYVPEFEKCWNRVARSIGSSWRIDETDISIKGKWNYLYRAVIAMYQATGCCDCCDVSPPLGAESEFRVQST
jgi:transposase-like protein